MTDGDVGVVVLHLGHRVRPKRPRPSASSGSPDGRRRPPATLGCRTGRRTGGWSARRRASVSRLPMSPMCWLTKASCPRPGRTCSSARPRPPASGPARTAGGRGGGRSPGSGGAAARSRCPVDLEHRVVARDVDGSVVEQPRVGDGSQPSAGVVVLVADRLVGEVATRHHQHVGHRGRGVGPRNRREQEMMQRRVGQQHPEPRVAGGHQLGDGGSGRALRRRSRTMGRWADVRSSASAGSMRASVRATSRSGP